MISKFRGHDVNTVDGVFYYTDTGESTASTWMNRPCGHCKLYNTSEDHDGCLGTLPDVINACCGHGLSNEAYVQFNSKDIIRGNDALGWIQKVKKG